MVLVLVSGSVFSICYRVTVMVSSSSMLTPLLDMDWWGPPMVHILQHSKLILKINKMKWETF